MGSIVGIFSDLGVFAILAVAAIGVALLLKSLKKGFWFMERQFLLKNALLTKIAEKMGIDLDKEQYKFDQLQKKSKEFSEIINDEIKDKLEEYKEGKLKK